MHAAPVDHGHQTWTVVIIAFHKTQCTAGTRVDLHGTIGQGEAFGADRDHATRGYGEPEPYVPRRTVVSTGRIRCGGGIGGSDIGVRLHETTGECEQIDRIGAFVIRDRWWEIQTGDAQCNASAVVVTMPPERDIPVHENAHLSVECSRPSDQRLFTACIVVVTDGSTTGVVEQGDLRIVRGPTGAEFVDPPSGHVHERILA